MKSSIDAILRRPQAEYLQSLLPERDALLGRIEAYAAEFSHPIADPEVAQMMRVLVRARQPERLLEIGTNIGYSVICMGREISGDATIETIELDRRILETARGFVSEAALKCNVIFHQGAALDVLPRLAGPFDFVFIDCVKTEYPEYLKLVVPKLSARGMVVCDNLLWKGQVAEEPRSHDQRASTEALREFNRMLSSHPRLTSIILPLGDGLGVSIAR